MIDPTTDKGARATERLASELILWLTTVSPEGQLQSSPVWFLWEEGEAVVCSRATSPRIRNLEAEPRVSFNLNCTPDGVDVVTFEGVARFDGTELPPATTEAYRAKYAGEIESMGWTWEVFRRDYPVVLRIRPTRVRMI